MLKGTWETTVKKKKNRQASASKTEATEATAGDEWNETAAHTEEKPKPRNKTGGPPRLHGRHNDSRGCKYHYLRVQKTSHLILCLMILDVVEYFSEFLTLLSVACLNLFWVLRYDFSEFSLYFY